MVYAPAVCREIGSDFPDCTRCRSFDADALRERYGCVEPARSPVFTVACSACAGDGCTECHGSGERAFFRCPRRELEAAGRADIARLLPLYHDYSERGVLAGDGGVLDQDASLMAAFGVFGDERAQIERQRDEHREQQAKKGAGWR